ncbi:MAG: 16S rRNA (cytidine(1402)-2'-O)-methyltransferase [Desulfobacterales bacterium]|nr:16S rRNA (cytidine(1402)-2'-O)-methyltransferase [Desulfobacterales bacterium]
MRSSLPTEKSTRTPDRSFGTLYVVATPIGHMEDITLRAIRTLKEAGLIAAEDTRQTRKLLTRYEVSTPLVSYHDHNKEKRTPELLGKLKAGTSIALVTDAGTPSISDPGHYLVREAIREAVPVVPIPGVSAMIAALSVSGLPTDTFVFIGFVPRKASKRKELLDQLKREPRTLIFYESPKRLLGLMQEILKVMGDRKAVIARELTKLHEEIFRGPLGAMVEEISTRPPLKGECTLLVAGREEGREIDRESLLNHLRRLRDEKDRSLSDLTKQIAREYGVSKKVVYEEALKLKKEG